MRWLLFLACLLALFVALTPNAPHGASASTCHKILVPDPNDRIDSGLKYSPLIAIGIVTSERLTDDAYDESAYRGYESTVKLLSVLKGDLPEREITIPHLNQDCPGGGARLRQGERVLIILNQNCYAYRSGVQEDCHWAMWDGGKILLKPGKAILEDVSYKPVFLGVPDYVVRSIGARAGASEEQVEAALQAAAIPPAESSSTLAFVIVMAIAGLVALLVVARRSSQRGAE